jgi:2,4-dienoyl-CoA reductase-like NADH-dependent reductase (Old Yellow Enzyme family)
LAGLFDPLRLRGLTLRNRVGVAPMCQFSSVDGFASDWHLVHLGARAAGGAGLVMTEATAVTPEGRISSQDLGLWRDEHVEPLARAARFVSGQGAAAGVQLAHAGRKGSRTPPWGVDGAGRERALTAEEGAWELAGPSPLAFDETHPAPHEMSLAEISAAVEAFGRAAERALAAGFDVIEVHAAHGYLVSSFNSPLSNQRTDAYGGSFDNRIRLAREVAQAIRRVWPEERPLFFRLSATDWLEGGWTVEDTVALARKLAEDGVDLIDCSSGGVALAPIPVGPAYQAPLAAAVRKGSGVATAAVGLIEDAQTADALVRDGSADLILLGRSMLRDPYWPQRAALELGCPEAARTPIQYATAWRKRGFGHEPLAVPLVAGGR